MTTDHDPLHHTLPVSTADAAAIDGEWRTVRDGLTAGPLLQALGETAAELAADLWTPGPDQEQALRVALLRGLVTGLMLAPYPTTGRAVRDDLAAILSLSTGERPHLVLDRWDTGTGRLVRGLA